MITLNTLLIYRTIKCAHVLKYSDAPTAFTLNQLHAGHIVFIAAQIIVFTLNKR